MRRNLLIALTVLALSCCTHGASVQTTFAPAYPEKNQAGDAIVAVFEGRIPCPISGCDKLKVDLVLYGREGGLRPTTYWLGEVGVGNDAVVQQGDWTIQRGLQDYPSGQVYVLDSRADPTLRYLWRVNNDVVLILDSNLKPRIGNAAWGFMLSRDCAPYGPRTFPYDERTKRFVPVNVSNCETS